MGHPGNDHLPHNEPRGARRTAEGGCPHMIKTNNVKINDL